MEVAGYLGAVLIGISLGLIGAGGSILTVPVLVYLFSIDAVLATTYSLFIVGTTSIAGSLTYFKKGLVHLKTVLLFGIPSIISVFFTRAYILPAIPHNIFNAGNFTVTKSILLLLLFAVLMIFASYKMIKKCKDCKGDQKQVQHSNYRVSILQGTFVGFVTGLIGAGGGFLIIPALVNLLKLPMKTAVGTSLLIISINSITGFLFSLHNSIIDWKLLLMISTIAIIGILVGSFISTKINGSKLKPAFGWFVLVMGIYIIIKETWLK